MIGVDLNRQWAEPQETSHPTIFHLKRLMRSYIASDQLLLFCDFHGHSRKRNIFAYACETLRGSQRLRERVFPRLLADCPHFSLGGCSFKVLRSKETTGRVVVWRQFATPNSFTLEASFCGSDFGAGAGAHYTTDSLKEMGAAFVPALVDFTDPSQSRVNQIMNELEQQYPAPGDGDEDEGEADVDASLAGNGAMGGEAAEKLRRAVRCAAGGRRTTAGSSSGKVAAGSGGGAGGKKAGAADHKGGGGDAKKKKKPGAGAPATANAGGLSPRTTRGPH